MKRNRRGDPLDSPSEFSARSALTWSDDGQTLTIETPQLKATGVGLMLIGAGCLIVAFLRPRAEAGLSTESAARDQNITVLWMLASVVIAAGGGALFRHAPWRYNGAQSGEPDSHHHPNVLRSSASTASDTGRNESSL